MRGEQRRGPGPGGGSGGALRRLRARPRGSQSRVRGAVAAGRGAPGAPLLRLAAVVAGRCSLSTPVLSPNLSVLESVQSGRVIWMENKNRF